MVVSGVMPFSISSKRQQTSTFELLNHVISLAIYDITRREVLSPSPNKKQHNFDTYSLAPAVYLLCAQTANATKTVQLLKK